MNVKIINLFADAILPNTSLKGKRGNSFYLEFEKEKILFDTGSNGAFLLHNMNILGISPNSIDKIVLSHGHFDHTRGIENLLKNRTKSDKIPIIAHPDFQQQRYVKIIGIKLFNIGFSKLDPNMEDKINYVLVKDSYKINDY